MRRPNPKPLTCQWLASCTNPLARRRLATVLWAAAYLVTNCCSGLFHDHSGHSCGHAEHACAPQQATHSHAAAVENAGPHHACAGRVHAGHARSEHAEQVRDLDTGPTLAQRHFHGLSDDDCAACRHLGKPPLATPLAEIEVIASLVAQLKAIDIDGPVHSLPRVQQPRAPPRIA